MTSPEFIFLNGEAARVTSFKRDQATGGFKLIVIARGGADRDRLLDLLNADDLSVRLDSGPVLAMRTTDVEVRSVGEGPRANHRIQAEIIPLEGSLPEPALRTGAPESSHHPLEQRLDQIIDLLTQIRDRI